MKHMTLWLCIGLVVICGFVYLVVSTKRKIEGSQPPVTSTDSDLAALTKLRADAEQGDAEAQKNLGRRYSGGTGVPQDETLAAHWLRKAADQGLDKAQYMLGVVYATGHGVPQDEAQAVQWYRKAADQGYAGAQEALTALSEH